MVPDHGLSARSQKSTPAPASLGRLVPVAFVVCNILVLYNIYTWLHIVPMINHENTRSRGMAEGCVFNILVGLMTICYARCLLTSPGGIPDREQDPAWEYVGQDGRPSQMREGLIETKRDGQRRSMGPAAKIVAVAAVAAVADAALWIIGEQGATCTQTCEAKSGTCVDVDWESEPQTQEDVYKLLCLDCSALAVDVNQKTAAEEQVWQYAPAHMANDPTICKHTGYDSLCDEVPDPRMARQCKCEGVAGTQPPCPGEAAAKAPAGGEACEHKSDGCEIDCQVDGSPLECDGTSCCELFQEALAELHGDGGSSDPSAEVGCGMVLEVVQQRCESCSACRAGAAEGGARVLTDGALAGRRPSGAAAAAALAALGAAAVLGGAAAALGRGGAARARAAAREAGPQATLEENAPINSAGRAAPAGVGQAPRGRRAARAMVGTQSTAEAFETHLQAITLALDLQAKLVRSALDLHPAWSPLDSNSAEGAISRVSAAISDLRHELGVATTTAGPGEPPTTTAVEALADKAYPSSATMAAPIAGLSTIPKRRLSFASRGSFGSRSSNGSQLGRHVQRIPTVEEEPEAGQRMDVKSLNYKLTDSCSIIGDDNDPAIDGDLPMWSLDSIDTNWMTRASVSAVSMRHTSPCVHGSLNPDWSLRLAWDLFVISMVLCDCVILPYQLAEFRTDKGFDAVWLWFTVIIFLCDLILNFFTGYHAGKKDEHLQEGTLVTDRKSVAIHYLRGWFWIDFLSTVPWSKVAEAFNSDGRMDTSSAGQVTKLAKIIKLTRLLRLMRMLRLYKVSVVWESLEGRIGSITALNVVSMLRVLGIWTAICHWGACVWWMVGKRDSLVMLLTMQDDVPDGLHWTELPRVHSAYDDFGQWRWVDRPAFEQYIFCFYWILGVMRTMPAEVTPVNLTERIFVLVFMFFAVMAFAVNVTRITQAWFRFGARKDAFKEEMACVRMHLRTMKCGNAVQLRTQAFLKHLFEKRKIHAKELGLLNTLPEGLKRKLNHSHRIHYLRMIPRLRDWMDQALQLVCDATTAVDFLPGDKLTMKDHEAEAAYVLMRGGLQVYVPSSRQASLLHGRPSNDSTATGLLSMLWRMSLSNESQERLTVVDDHCLFDHEGIVVPLCRDTVVVMECSELLRIDRQAFKEAMKELRVRRNHARNRRRELEMQRLRMSDSVRSSHSRDLRTSDSIQARVSVHSGSSSYPMWQSVESANVVRFRRDSDCESIADDSRGGETETKTPQEYSQQKA
ncbi:unnamed protein product [Prorocentrum cordatum]|uniref:Ion transport domain-containing protein n=1 Tax=Prorocentrum cordatum TaxID=2364126 RepID=A0ABN9TNZ4_9DINO|nr:unnamed protein product [Polarella glacialis]